MEKWCIPWVLFFSPLYPGLGSGEACNMETPRGQAKKKFQEKSIWCFLSQWTKKGTACQERIFFLIIMALLSHHRKKYEKTIYLAWPHQQRPSVKPRFLFSSVGNEIHYLSPLGCCPKRPSLQVCFKHCPKVMSCLLHPHPVHGTRNLWNTWGSCTCVLI